MRDKVADDQRIAHIKDAIKEIEEYNNGVINADFKANSMVRC